MKFNKNKLTKIISENLFTRYSGERSGYHFVTTYSINKKEDIKHTIDATAIKFETGNDYSFVDVSVKITCPVGNLNETIHFSARDTIEDEGQSFETFFFGIIERAYDELKKLKGDV